MKMIFLNALCMASLICFGITSTHAQMAPNIPADTAPRESVSRIHKHPKSREELKVSKFLDEAEENLPKVFDRAEDRSWDLNFDEGDDLFNRDSEDTDSGEDDE